MSPTLPTRTGAAVVAQSAPLALAVAAATLFTVVGCSAVVQGNGVRSTASAQTVAAEAGCNQVDALMTRIPSDDGEPVARIPQPSGWKSSTKMTSEMIPFTMGNTDLNAGGFTPNALVTREVVDSAIPAADVFAQSEAALASVGASDLTVTPSSVCGLPAERIGYTVPALMKIDPHPAEVLVVAVPAGDQTFAYTVTVQSTDPTNATYQQDSRTILDGFEVKPPGA